MQTSREQPVLDRTRAKRERNQLPIGHHAVLLPRQNGQRCVTRWVFPLHNRGKAQRMKNSPPLALLGVLFQHSHQLAHPEAWALGGQEFLGLAAAA
jgi:hypothetical protein